MKSLLEACVERIREYDKRSGNVDIPSVENALYCLCKELVALETILLAKSS